MRKMTIFRSSSLVVLVGVAAAPLLSAQQQQSHTVVEGETLWAIAGTYFGDPFLWPEIYRINTDVVEDPHWIFPGEVLRLQPPQPVDEAAAPEIGDVREVPPAEGPELAEESIVRVAAPEVEGAAPPPPPPSEMTPTIFARVDRRNVLQADFSGPAPRSASRGAFNSAGFLTEGEMLPFGVVRGVVGRANLASVEHSSAAMIYQEIEVAPPEGGSYAIGDSLLIAQVERNVTDWGRIVRPGGIAVVRRPAESGSMVAQLVAQFNSVTDGHLILPLEPFPDPGAVVPVPVEDGMVGTVLADRDQTPLPGQQRIVFIDRGRVDGVTLGDVFVMEAPDETGATLITIATLQIVHTRENSSSGIILGINDLGVGAGAQVRLVRKMPS